MANPEHVEIVKKGAGAIAAWREDHPETILDLSKANLDKIKLNSANLRKANLREVSLNWAELSKADLQEADLRKASLECTHLIGANLSKTKMAGATLFHTKLSGADLTAANLADIKSIDADFSQSSLRRVYLGGANLFTTDLSGADLTGACLEYANVFGGDISGAVFCDVEIYETEFSDVDLSGVYGLDTVKHWGPSSIGVDTLLQLNGTIPKMFLRGCGVPEILIEYLPSLIGHMQPIQFYSCFISHSSKDDEFVRRLHGRLEQEKLRVWYAPEDLKGGRKLDSQIDEAIRVHDKLLLVLSPNSMSSEWVRREIKKARKKEKQTGQSALFPISLVPFSEIRDWECLDSDSGEDLAEKVREFYIPPDFSCWKEHDQFEAAFAKLMADLRASASPS